MLRDDVLGADFRGADALRVAGFAGVDAFGRTTVFVRVACGAGAAVAVGAGAAKARLSIADAPPYSRR